MNILLLTIAPKIEQKMIRDIIHEFIYRGHQVYVVCPADSQNEPQDNFSFIDDAKYLFVKSGYSTGKVNLLRKAVNFLTVNSTFENATKKAHSECRIDLILYLTPPITFVKAISNLKKKTGAKTYLMLKDIFPQNAVDMGMMKRSGLTGLVWRYFRNKEKKLYRISDFIGCMSPANCEYVLKENPEIGTEKVGICVNSYREEPLIQIDRNLVRKKYGLPTDRLIFLYGGNLGKPQGLQYFVEVLKQNLNRENCYFLICGSGKDQGRIEDFIKDNHPANVQYMKPLSPEKFDELSRACDVGMVFLDRRFTIPNYPSRILSIMLNALPVLAATDLVSDVKDMIADANCGWWCESKEPSDMTGLIDEICAMPDVAKEKGRNARDYYLTHFTTKIACDQIEEGLKKIRMKADDC